MPVLPVIPTQPNRQPPQPPKPPQPPTTAHPHQQDLVELASDALLPLLLADPSAFQPLAASLITTVSSAQGADPRAADALTGALASLAGWLRERAGGAAANGEAAGGGLGRQLQRDFRQRMCQLVADVRAFTKMR